MAITPQKALPPEQAATRQSVKHLRPSTHDDRDHVSDAECRHSATSPEHQDTLKSCHPTLLDISVICPSAKAGAILRPGRITVNLNRSTA
jgi:hypothetical protein